VSTPFGFGPTGGDEPSGDNPFGALFGGNPADLGAALHRFADMLSWQGGPVNWDLARQGALQAAGDGDPGVFEVDTERVTEAVRLADVWLDGATALPSGVTATEAWSRRHWVEATLEVWRSLVDPVASRVVDAMGSALGSSLGSAFGGVPGLEAPAGGAEAFTGPLLGMLRQFGGAMFGAQLAQALGSLAREVVSSTDIGLPLGPVGRASLLPANVAAFGEGLGVSDDEVRIYLALREAAHHRLFGHVPWLRSRLLEAVEAYARGIEVDTSALEAAVRDVDPSNPESLQRALEGNLFQPQTTQAQRAALTRLETLLALVEGWVDEVVAAAAEGPLPSAGALRETVRRRRASGGPGEQTFAALVGLELRPRRLRDAAELWRALAQARGTDARDAVWAHPDLLPRAEDLDDPSGFARRSDDDLDLSALPQEPEPDEQ
jgi:putative hydrolase